jgi:hypothetical protein
MYIGSNVFDISLPLQSGCTKALEKLNSRKNKVVREEAVKIADGINVDSFISTALINNIKKAYTGAELSIKLAALKATKGNVHKPKITGGSIRQVFMETYNAANQIVKNCTTFANNLIHEDPDVAAIKTFRKVAKLAEIDRLKQELVEIKPQAVIKTSGSIIDGAIEMKESQISKLMQILPKIPEQVKDYKKQLTEWAEKQALSDPFANEDLLIEATETIEKKARILKKGEKVINFKDTGSLQKRRKLFECERNKPVTDLTQYRNQHPNAEAKRKEQQITAEYNRLEKLEEMKALAKGNMNIPEETCADKRKKIFETEIYYIQDQIKAKIEQFQLEKRFLESAKTDLK